MEQKSKEEKILDFWLTAICLVFALIFVAGFIYLIFDWKKSDEIVVRYEQGEVSEGIKELEMQNIEEIEITEISEYEFEDVVIEEEFEGNPNIPLSVELQELIQVKCEEYSVNEAIVLAIMESESTFRTDVGTEKVLGGNEGGARYYGYMQLSKENCNRAMKEFGLDAHTPEGNIEYSIILLSELINKYGELDLVITAYKAGESVADSGKTLKVCDKLTDRVMYWQEIINE